MKRKILRSLAVTLLAVAVLVAGYALWTPFTLAKIRDREETWKLSSDLKQEIRRETERLKAEAIMDYSIRKTARMLSFHVTEDRVHRRAHCVGYATLCAAIANHAFRTHHIEATATPVVGYVMFHGINLCEALADIELSEEWERFVRDHDFVEFQIDGRTIYADPCIYDLTWKDCKTYRTTKTKTKTK